MANPSKDQVQDLRKVGLHPDFWHPLARSSEVPKGGMLAASYAGEPILLVRPKDGPLYALENRCAHRQVPLSEGACQDGKVRCGYHGWTYDASGRCVDVPYLGKGAEDAKIPNGVRSYPCRERYGLVFVFPGDPKKAAAAAFPEIPSAETSDYKIRTLDRRVACHYSFMHENLMDMNHQFLHRSLMGGIQATLVDFLRGDGWVEARYTFKRTHGEQSWGEKFMLGKRSAPSAETHDFMKIRTEYPYQTLRFHRADREAPVLDLWLDYIPVDREQRVNRSFGLMMIRKPRVPLLIHLFWPAIVRFTEGIFGQDRRIVELEQKAHDAQGADWNQEPFPVIQALRDLLRGSGVPL